MPLIEKIGKNPFSKALLVGIPLAASVGGMGTIIGSPTNAIAVGVLENNGYNREFFELDVFWISTCTYTYSGRMVAAEKKIHQHPILPSNLNCRLRNEPVDKTD